MSSNIKDFMNGSDALGFLVSTKKIPVLIQDPMSISWDDATWIMTSSFIIFTMQSGFGLLESGCVSKKNEVNIMVKNAVDVIFGGLGYWMFGYGMSFGQGAGTNPFIGIGSYFIDADEKEMGSIFATYIFQLSFATTATTIVSGAMAERCNFLAYCIFSFCNTAVFCIPAGWIWRKNGFLKTLHVVDIAGCASVHLVGGASSLVAAIMLKPRTGRFDHGIEPPPMGSPTNAMVGMFMLWWGWLGFNCGSTFGVSGHKWKYAARSAIATINSSVGGGMAALTFSYIAHKKKFMILDFITGILASLVSVTAGCALYHPWEALIVGTIGSLVANVTTPILNKLNIDDPVGAIAVHGSSAIWGMLAVGIIVEKDSLLSLSKGNAGLFRGGGWYLLGIQTLAAIIIIIWSFACTFLLLFTINKLIPIRMSLEDELAGADFVEHNIRYEWNTPSKVELCTIKDCRGIMEPLTGITMEPTPKNSNISSPIIDKTSVSPKKENVVQTNS
ncbi:putative ammonium transporter 3 [Limulus polyphemus]|uniref:Ammonium transporter n=1 Tax=Limulus polyphemus TaxID=6850 RepID=A0ABM1B3P3_LIMPO|nr:putative ammonium transporter 3 [Limulus polyphemus]